MDGQLNQRITHIPVPYRMQRLPISDEGYPVPWFVPTIDGKPEFRGFDGERLYKAINARRCWLCGEQLGKFMTFVIGPMCAVNRNTAEPPCHFECALYAAKACPFLTQPRMRRNEKDMPEGDTAGIAIKRNPGVVLLWTTKDYRARSDHTGGVLITIGDPLRVAFYAQGRHATRDEILMSIETGMPLLRELCDTDEDKVELERMYRRAIKLVPAA